MRLRDKFFYFFGPQQNSASAFRVIWLLLDRIDRINGMVLGVKKVGKMRKKV